LNKDFLEFEFNDGGNCGWIEPDFADAKWAMEFSIVFATGPMPVGPGRGGSDDFEVPVAVKGSDGPVESHEMGAQAELDWKIAQAAKDAELDGIDRAGQCAVGGHQGEGTSAVAEIQAQDSSLELRITGWSMGAQRPAFFGCESVDGNFDLNDGVFVLHELEVVDVDIAIGACSGLDQQGESHGATLDAAVVGASPVPGPGVERNDHMDPLVWGAFDWFLKSLTCGIGVSQGQFVAGGAADSGVESVGALGDLIGRLGWLEDDGYVLAALGEVEVQSETGLTVVGGCGREFKSAGGARKLRSGGELY
jgi:hypothetical protein